MNKEKRDAEIEKSAAELIAELEEDVATIIIDQERILRQMCDWIDECRANAHRTSGHLASLRKSVLHVTRMPLDDLTLHYSERKATSDRRMLREARKMISLISLDDSNLEAATRREIEGKIGREAEMRDFIRRAEDGVEAFRKIYHEAETHCETHKAQIEASKAMLSRILANVRSNDPADPGKGRKLVADIFALAIFYVTCFAMYFNT